MAAVAFANDAKLILNVALNANGFKSVDGEILDAREIGIPVRSYVNRHAAAFKLLACGVCGNPSSNQSG